MSNWFVSIVSKWFVRGRLYTLLWERNSLHVGLGFVVVDNELTVEIDFRVHGCRWHDDATTSGVPTSKKKISQGFDDFNWINQRCHEINGLWKSNIEIYLNDIFKIWYSPMILNSVFFLFQVCRVKWSINYITWITKCCCPTDQQQAKVSFDGGPNLYLFCILYWSSNSSSSKEDETPIRRACVL